VVPLTKCGLLDASVRKCFNSDAADPMKIDVQEQPKDSPNATQHDIRLGLELRQRRNPHPSEADDGLSLRFAP